jgi:putative transposase
MTRLTAFNVGDLVHCIKRGAFGNVIFREESDYWRFVRLLYLCNEEFHDANLYKTEKTLKIFERPAHWPAREPLVDIIAWVAMPNHFHLLLREKKEGGVGKFMQRLCSSITNGFNVKYENRGTIFQGKYRPVIVTNEQHLEHLIPYIVSKNTLELYPEGGLRSAMQDLPTAWQWAKEYRFSSLLSCIDTFPGTSPIISQTALVDLGYPKSEADMRKLSRECIELNLSKHFGD